MRANSRQEDTRESLSVTLRDVSDRKKAEQSKNQLISVVSHELRTPLTVIHGALGLLAARPDRSPQDAKLIDMATRHTTLLIRLLNDLLDVERIESGATVLQSQLLPAGPLLHHAVELVHRFAEERVVSINIIRTDAMRDLTVWADPDRVTQVLVNLLNNAVNFSPANGVITLGITPPESSAAPVQFWMRDEGYGIPADQLEHIFDRFVQIGASDKDKRGKGLGLALCRAIVHQHGGRIWAESEDGRGSTFFFELPRQDPNACDTACDTACNASAAFPTSEA
jgi:signal transduction histidine kinase